MASFNYHTTTKRLLGDLFTPVSLYMRLRDLYPQSMLMESSDYHGSENAKSFIGIDPMASIQVAHGTLTMTFPDGSSVKRDIPVENSDKPKLAVAKAMNDFLGSFHVEGEGCQYYGIFGFTSANAVRYFENIPVKDTTMERNDAPDILYILFKDIIVFDHFNNMIDFITLGTADELQNLLTAANKPNVKPYGFHAVGGATSTLTDEEHKANIRRCVRHCLRGDVFQIVISRRFIQKYEGDDFKLYRVLRSINPSPYLFYFDFGGYRIFGSSPETHNRIVGNKAFIDPIAGTTKRTGNTEQDRKNAEFLRNDPKENAEHVMLVDLARNDLSRNCHNVKVDFYKDMQYYSHVIHLVSRVSGELNDGADHTLEFIDTFPAGTLSGAPKVRALQLINEMEPHNRGAYGGCIGSISLNGDLNQAIVIRTFISRNGELWFQAGSGVTAKSNDDYELQESNNKLGALVKAIKEAERL
ncbi:MAG: anthranilate synthase component I family protein [Prevotella sp.]|nr:anthranilate synthase component I family protein [Prevotella sp.]